jgi:outer membrane protein TolC
VTDCGGSRQHLQRMKYFSFVSIFFASVLVVVAQTNTDTVVLQTNADTVVWQTNVDTVTVQTNADTVAAQTNVDAVAVQTNTDTVVLQTNVYAVVVETNTAAVRAMSLQNCFQEALAHNFDVQIERYNPQISLYNLDAAYAGYDPQLNFSATHEHNVSGLDGFPAISTDGNTFKSSVSGGTPWGMTYSLSGNVSDDTVFPLGTNTFRGQGTIEAQVTQPLLKNFWIDTTRLTIRVDKNRLHFSEQGLRDQIITSVTAVANAYFELIYAQDNVKVQQEALDLAQTQLDQDKQRVQIGTLAQLSVQSDESQVAQSRANLIAAQSTLETDQNTLKNLVTDSYSKWHDMDIQPTATLTAPLQLFDLQDSWNKGMTERPDLLQARLNVEQQGIQLKFYQNQMFPELDLIGTFGYNGSGREFSSTLNQFREANRPFYQYGAQISVPLSNVGPRNQYKSEKAVMQQVVLQLKQFEQNVMVEIDNAVKQAQSDYESVDATREARIYAEAALDAEQKTYAVGKATTFEVLQYQSALTAARGQEIRALANYEEALANLAAQEGSTLEQNGIDIQAK